MLASDDVISVRIQTASLFLLEDGVKFNIWDCQHSLSLIIMSSDEIGSLGLFIRQDYSCCRPL